MIRFKSNVALCITITKLLRLVSLDDLCAYSSPKFSAGFLLNLN